MPPCGLPAKSRARRGCGTDRRAGLGL